MHTRRTFLGSMMVPPGALATGAVLHASGLARVLETVAAARPSVYTTHEEIGSFVEAMEHAIRSGIPAWKKVAAGGCSMAMIADLVPGRPKSVEVP